MGGRSAWSIGKPQPNGALLLFRHYPDGALMSVPSRDVKKIVATSARPEEGKRLRPGESIEIEASDGESAAGGAAVAGKPAVPPPGSRKDGTALFPDRPYNPDGGFVNNLGGASFETSWYDWGPYAAKMLRRIKPHWKISQDLMLLAQKGIVRIGFSIMADGRVADVKQIRSSTTLPYDQAALKAIVESNPFDPLPKNSWSSLPGRTGSMWSSTSSTTPTHRNWTSIEPGNELARVGRRNLSRRRSSRPDGRGAGVERPG